MKSFLFILSVLWASFAQVNPPTYLEEFETGYKYVIDNQEQLDKLSEEDFVAHITEHFGIRQGIRIRTLAEVLSQQDNPWSGDLTALLIALDNGISSAQSFDDFLRALSTFENGAMQLHVSERDRALQYIRNLRDAMELLYNSLQFYNRHAHYSMEMLRWWGDFGKCVAGILGGIGSGGLGGAAIGAATAVGIGAIPGAVIGGIAGGLTAAANFC